MRDVQAIGRVCGWSQKKRQNVAAESEEGMRKTLGIIALALIAIGLGFALRNIAALTGTIGIGQTRSVVVNGSTLSDFAVTSDTPTVKDGLQHSRKTLTFNWDGAPYTIISDKTLRIEDVKGGKSE